MSSIIQSLTQKYKAQIEKQQSWAVTSDQQKAELARLQKLADTFMSLIVQLCYSEQKILKVKDDKIKDKANELLNLKSKQRKISANQFKRIIGKYINDEFTNNNSFNGIKTEFELIFEEDQEEQSSAPIFQNSMMFDDDQQQTYKEFLSELQSQMAKSTFSIKKSSSKLQNEKISETWGNDPHQMRVMAYLTQIGAPQTQLSYLCQSMGWKLNFSEKLIQGKFEVTAEVNFSFKKVEKILKQSYLAPQKKLGRLVSSFKMLKKIYMSFPEIWDIYEEIRTSKSLIIEKHPFNPLNYLQPQILNERVEPISKIKSVDRDEQFQKQKSEYIKNISSFKSQLNLLSQQNPGVFTLKMDKIQVNNPGPSWRVKGELNVKYKGKQKMHNAIDQNLSSKIAEQTIARLLVSIVYDEYKQILQKMIMIKNKKSIKT